MTPEALIQTAVMMGLLVLAGGAWSLLYCLGKTRARADFTHMALGCYIVALGLAVAIGVYSPLSPGWKALVLVSALAYAGIPPVTLRYLEQIHDYEGEEA